MKITTPDDLGRATPESAIGPRVGTGYDLHRLVDGRPLVLAGVRFPVRSRSVRPFRRRRRCATRSSTRSSAPRARATSAGTFPTPTRPGRTRRASTCSRRRLRSWMAWAGRSSNVDVTVFSSARTRAAACSTIRKNLARVLRPAAGRELSVKAKTNEGVDAVGRGEAIAAHAVAMVASVLGRPRDADARSLCAEPDRPSARRQRPDGAVQLAARARPRRHVCAAHRRHRHRAIDARSEQSILDDLRWLGLDWDEGPDVGGTHGPVPAVRTDGPLRRRVCAARSASGVGVPLLLHARVARRRAQGGAGRRTCRRNTAAVAASCRSRRVRAPSRRRVRRRPFAFACRAGPRRDVPRPRPRRRDVQHAKSSAIRSSSGRTAGPPTTSPSSSTTCRWRSRMSFAAKITSPTRRDRC